MSSTLPRFYRWKPGVGQLILRLQSIEIPENIEHGARSKELREKNNTMHSRKMQSSTVLILGS